jgi:hypothetical protein
MIGAIFKALWAAISVFRQERQIYNRPDVVQAKKAEAIQEVKDRLSTAESILSDPNATPEQHAEALRQIRLAQS